MKESQIHISEDASAYIQLQLGKGDFTNASDYIESLVREDQLTRDQLDSTLADNRDALEKLVSDGLNSGEAIAVDEEYWTKKRQALMDEFGG